MLLEMVFPFYGQQSSALPSSRRIFEREICATLLREEARSPTVSWCSIGLPSEKVPMEDAGYGHVPPMVRGSTDCRGPPAQKPIRVVHEGVSSIKTRFISRCQYVVS